MTETEIVKKDLEEIYIGNLNTVDADLKLPLKGRNGSSFQWESKEILFISHDGKVTRPRLGVGNRKVTLQVEAKYLGSRASRVFEATVLEEPRKVRVKEIKKVIVHAEPGKRAELPPVVIVLEENGDAVTLPVMWDAYEPKKEEGILCVCGAAEDTEKKALAEIHYEKKKSMENKVRDKEVLVSFPAGSVTLKPGSMFYEAQEKMAEFLKKTDDDQMLYNFRAAAGLDTKGAQPMTGWDAPECNLKGHTTGHYLSALALSYSASGDEVLKKKMDYMVSGLFHCQKALEEKGWHKGFLSAYGEEQFDLLEEYTTYPTIWAPYYTLDKIMSGLYDCCTLGENHQALELLQRMGDWVYERLSVLTKEQRDRMWSMYIAGEFGGMIGILVKLYEKAGKERYYRAAEYFRNEKLFYPMAENVDTLKDMHANQHIPQIIGALEMYKAKGETRYLDIARNFWDMVTKGHVYTIGGTGETEMFHMAGHLTDYLTDKSAESCASYNMLRLTSGLFRMKPAGSRMDYYENTLCNHVLSSMSHAYDGGTTYFMPLRPGGQKEFSTEENTCCHGTGLESRFRYMEDIYMDSQESVYINLYIPSVLKTDKIHIEQTEETCGVIRFTVRIYGDKEAAFRVPGWTDGFEIRIGEEIYREAAADGYIHIRRNWNQETTVIVREIYTMREIVSPDNRKFRSLAYGPYILAEVSEEEAFRPLPDLQKMRRTENGKCLEFTEGQRRFVPLAEIDHEKYHVYFMK